MTSRFTTTREIMMMRVMNSISEKPEWDRKVYPTAHLRYKALLSPLGIR